MVYNEKAFDLFDAVQAVNIYQFREMKEMIVKKSLKTKVFKGKYLFLSKYYKNNNKITSENIDLLIAPSWNTKFYQLNCHLNLKQILPVLDLFQEKELYLREKLLHLFALQ